MTGRQAEKAISRQMVWLDLALVMLAFWMAVPIRNDLVPWVPFLADIQIKDIGANRWMAFVIVGMLPLMLTLQGFYRDVEGKRFSQACVAVFKALVAAGAIVGLGSVLGQLPVGNRGVMAIAILLAVSLVLVRWFIWRSWERREVALRQSKLAVLIIGSEESGRAFVESLGKEVTTDWGKEVFFDLANREIPELQEAIVEGSVQKVIFATTQMDHEKLCHAVNLCEIQGIEVWVPMDFVPLKIAQPSFEKIGGESVVILSSMRQYTLGMSIKSVFDRVMAAVLILLTLPLWVFAALGIRRSDPGPVFYRQKRSGRYGKPFMMWKFRSMYIDAEKRLEEVKRQVGNDMGGPVFKLENDPRIFSFGHFLRKTSIDELPQLLNVLMGDMSLVGPRPLPVYEVEAFPRIEDRRRLCVKPGITCYWQIEGRSSITSFEEWVEMDCRYIDNWSLWLDFVLLVKTVPAVLLRRGAK